MPSINMNALPSKRLVFSYVFDWIVIIAIAAVGGGWEFIKPYHRPFSLVDLSISYPFQTSEVIPTSLLAVIALVAPAVIILVVCLVFVPGPTASRGTPKSLIWKRKVWEWNTGWMGLALSCATAFLITQGMKLLFGKPRPDLLARCLPDMGRFEEARISSAGQAFNQDWVLVTSAICTQTDDHILQDGFKSFPSGHSSFAWAGLLYLTLFLASKFAVAIPFLPPRPFSTNPAYTSAITPSNLRHRTNTDSILPVHNKSPTDASVASRAYPDDQIVPIRYQAAAPPVYTLVLILIPIGSAIYIVSTRFTDFRHHGFDMLFGSFIGISTAWFSFRWYHLPVTRGAGWSWGPRSYERSWGIGVGVGSYVGTEGWSHKHDGDIEMQPQSSATNGHHQAAQNAGITESERHSGERHSGDTRIGGAHAV